MKKVLIIAYYWPPSGGSGVQRWLKFVKYLPSFGWEPYVFTPENPSFAVRDESLLRDVPPEAEVIRFPIWEPYELFFGLSKLTGQQKAAKPTEMVSNKKKSLFQKISTWIRGNFFIPDPRVFWVKPSAKFLDDFLRDNKIKTVITTGPPHSVHLIGLRLKKKNSSLHWIADFRDPWSEWGFLDSLKVGSMARKFHRQLEAKVLSTADKVVTITPFYVRQFEKLANRNVTLLTNGFDEDDFKSLVITHTDKFVIRHVGIVNEKCDPRPFLLALTELMQENSSFASFVNLDFVGEVHPEVKHFVSSLAALASVTTFTAPVPHKALMEKYGSSSLLLIILTGYKDAEGYMPGKLFEYLATGLPILGVGPAHGDAASLLNESKAGSMIAESDPQAIKKFLLNTYIQWQSAELKPSLPARTSQYSRSAITQKLVELLR